MKIKIHPVTEKPRINAMCLVFYKKIDKDLPAFYPDVCYYLDATDYDVEQFCHGKEGFYVATDARTEPVDPGWIRGWVDLDEIQTEIAKEPYKVVNKQRSKK